jgi:hypothetical protein
MASRRDTPPKDIDLFEAMEAIGIEVIVVDEGGVHMATRPSSRWNNGRKRKKMVPCPCCKGEKKLYVWHDDEATPRKEPCIHCEATGEIEIDIMRQNQRGME